MSENEAALPDFEAAWNYGAPVDTRKIFASMLAEAGDEAPAGWALELKTQIARTHSLKGEFDEAHAILGEVEGAMGDGRNKLRIRYLLERGRTFNSAGDKDNARSLFVEAWEIGKDVGEDFLAVDAAHMVAIAANEIGRAHV